MLGKLARVKVGDEVRVQTLKKLRFLDVFLMLFSCEDCEASLFFFDMKIAKIVKTVFLMPNFFFDMFGYPKENPSRIDGGPWGLV